MKLCELSSICHEVDDGAQALQRAAKDPRWALVAAKTLDTNGNTYEDNLQVLPEEFVYAVLDGLADVLFLTAEDGWLRCGWLGKGDVMMSISEAYRRYGAAAVRRTVDVGVCESIPGAMSFEEKMKDVAPRPSREEAIAAEKLTILERREDCEAEVERLRQVQEAKAGLEQCVQALRQSLANGNFSVGAAMLELRVLAQQVGSDTLVNDAQLFVFMSDDVHLEYSGLRVALEAILQNGERVLGQLSGPTVN